MPAKKSGKSAGIADQLIIPLHGAPSTRPTKRTLPQKTKKYQWEIGSPPPLIDRHSQAKHSILEEYIRCYTYRLMSNPNIPRLKLSIVDGFCGGGEYIDSKANCVDGSPLLALKAIQEARFKINHDRRNQRELDVTYSFVDAEKNHIDYLKEHIEKRYQEGKIDAADYSSIDYYSQPFFKALPKISQSIKDAKGGERAIFILDQFAYKDVPLPAVGSMLKTIQSSEVIMTFNVDNMITYLSEKAANRKAVSNIGLDQYIPWDTLNELKDDNSQEWRNVIQRCIAQGVKSETGAEYMNLFFVQPQGKNSWSYWLIHLSNHYRAHEVMKTLHWTHANIFSHELEPGYFVLGYHPDQDFGFTGQTTLFDNDHGKNACIDGLREHVGEAIFALKEDITVDKLISGKIGNSMGSEEHFFQVLSQLIQQKDILIKTKDGGLRESSKTYKSTDIISSLGQFRLFGCH